MLTKAGAKLLDFGLAKWHSAATPEFFESLATMTREPPLTDEGQVVGTLQYMAPEQLEGRAVDARTDLFAFGALVHEMATGRKAFEATSQASLVAAILGAEPPADLGAAAALATRARPRRQEMPGQGSRRTVADRARSGRRAEVDQSGQLAESHRASVPGASRPLSRLRSVTSLIAGAAIVLLAAAVVAGLWIWRQSADSLQATDLRLISTFSGEHWGASFSPDGNFIAFLKEVDGIPQVWVKNLAEGDPIQVTFGDVPVRRLVWSPLNDRIVFSRFRAGLWSVAPLGGPARRILEFGDAPKFSADGKRLVFTRGTGDLDSQRRWRRRPSKFLVCRKRPGPWIDLRICRQTDRRSLSFTRRRRHRSGVISGSSRSAGGQARQLTFDSCEGGWPSWTPDGRSIVFSSTRAGSLTLWRVTGSGRHADAADDRRGRGYRAGHFSRWEDAALRHAAQELEPDPDGSGDRPGEGTALPSDSNRLPSVLSQRRSDRVQSASGGWRAHCYVVSADGREVRQVTQGER